MGDETVVHRRGLEDISLHEEAEHALVAQKSMALTSQLDFLHEEVLAHAASHGVEVDMPLLASSFHERSAAPDRAIAQTRQLRSACRASVLTLQGRWEAEMAVRKAAADAHEARHRELESEHVSTQAELEALRCDERLWLRKNTADLSQAKSLHAQSSIEARASVQRRLVAAEAQEAMTHKHLLAIAPERQGEFQRVEHAHEMEWHGLKTELQVQREALLREIATCEANYAKEVDYARYADAREAELEQDVFEKCIALQNESNAAVQQTRTISESVMEGDERWISRAAELESELENVRAAWSKVEGAHVASVDNHQRVAANDRLHNEALANEAACMAEAMQGLRERHSRAVGAITSANKLQGMTRSLGGPERRAGVEEYLLTPLVS